MANAANLNCKNLYAQESAFHPMGGSREGIRYPTSIEKCDRTDSRVSSTRIEETTGKCERVCVSFLRIEMDPPEESVQICLAERCKK